MNNKSFSAQFRFPAWGEGIWGAVKWIRLIIVLAFSANRLCAQQFGISASDLAPAQMFDGQSRAVLQIDLSNPAGGGVATVRLDSLGLRFEATAGTPLSAESLSALIATMEIYRDANGSGTFEPAGDALVANAAYLPVAANGSVNFLFESADPAALQAASGTTVTYFIVVKLTGTASAATPHTLRVTHLANGPSATTARNAATSAPLTMLPTADISSSVVIATFNTPPTAIGLGPLVAREPSRPAALSLLSGFQDAEDTPAQMTYSVTGNTNPGLFGFVGIDPSTGILTVDQVAGANGVAQLTVQATDTAGKSVSTTLAVHVGPIATYSAFADAYFGSGGAGISGVSDDPGASGVINLLKYAYFLNPLKNADRAGLPKFQRTVNTRVFSHLRPKYATDLLYTYEISQNLISWSPAVSGVDYFAGSSDLGDGSIRVECVLLGNAPRAFLRVRTQLTSDPPPPGGGGGSGLLAGSVTSGEPSGTGASDGSTDSVHSPALTPGYGLQTPPLPIHSSVVFPSETQALEGDELNLPSAVTVADMNSDGWQDIVSISEGDDRVSWYPNVNGTFGPRQILGGVTRGGQGVAVADFTGDGLPDIASASWVDNKIAWYRNLGGGVFANQQVISTNAASAVAVAVADVDNDGLPDIISAGGVNSTSKLAWYKNHGAPTYFVFGQEHPILGASGTTLSASGNAPYDLAVADLDQDPNGYVDIAVVSFNDSTVSFLRGTGNGAFTRQILSTTQQGAIEVTLGDIDGDGLKDIISISAQGGQVTWFKNNGSAPFGPANVIAIGIGGLNGLTVSDLNKDGKIDVIVSTVRPFGMNIPARVLCFENLGGGAFGDPLSNAQVIAMSGNEGKSVASADFDHNGLMDAAVAWQSSSKISVHLNVGGQFSLATTNTAPSTIYESGRDDVLRIALTNHGSAGEDSAQLATLSLLFEKSPGVPMTTAEANQLIANLHVFVDSNDSGAFEPGVDNWIATAHHLSLTAGKASVSLRYGKPADASVPPGATRNFFVVPEATANGAAQNPKTFRVTHIVEGPAGTTAREAYSGTTLTLQGGASNLTTPLVTVQANFPPATTGLPNITVFDDASSTIIQLATYFSDVEDGAALLHYKLTHNTNPALFSFVGIAPNTDRLSLKYRPGATGAAVLTIRATDSLGKSVSTTFQVTVGFTYADWLNLYPGAGAAGNSVPPALAYAFALNPLAPGDLTGAPRAWKQGSIRGLSHLKQRWANDLTYSYEISPDLVNWELAVNGLHYYEFRNQLTNGIDQSDLMLLVPWPRAFLRPRAESP